MASANQIYFTIENARRIWPKETCSFLGWQDSGCNEGSYSPHPLSTMIELLSIR